MNFKNRLFILIYIFGMHSVTAQNAITLLTQEKQFVAGSTNLLEFKTSNRTSYQLYCTNSYGSTLLNSEFNNGTVVFKIPAYIGNKTGVVGWKIIGSTESISGKFTITPKQKPASLESYIGPPSIEAGGTDFTMLVVIPTDELDNPLKQHTKVGMKHQFMSSEKETPIFTNNLIAYQTIFSPLKSGRMILSSESLGLNSKEYDVNIMPAIGTNFKIFSKRNHAYADGNQITTFSTSIIKDKNNNIVSDGTFVAFFITNKKGNILKTSGTTINGIANAKMIHPDHEEVWKIKAYIAGISESNCLEISYKKVIESFDIHFSDTNRTLKVGPLKSFMNQMIPDGLRVSLSIYKEGEFVNNIFKTTNDGFVTFDLDSNIYENGNYNLEVTAAGITQKFKAKKLW
mgnify:CR=1 FL=1